MGNLPSLREELARRHGAPLVIGHRGAMGYRPENTMASFRHGLELGADWVECDVHLTRDGHLVVMHDETLDRTTNGSGPIRAKTLAEIRALDAGSWFGPDYAGERVPTLDELLEWAAVNQVVVDIEIKSTPLVSEDRAVETKLVEVLEKHALAERVIVISFDHGVVKRLKELDGRIATGVLYAGRPLNAVEVARAATADAVLPQWAFVTVEDVQAIHAAGLAVAPWATSDPDALRKLTLAGVDAVGTNHPDVMRRVVEEVLQRPSP